MAMLGAAVVGCGAETAATIEHREARWYTAEQVDLGRTLFQRDCAFCHGRRAEGTPDWREPGADGHYPPPPLNGTAHAWHHPISVLQRTIDVGGVPLGGAMPGFEGVLSADESRATIAYFQSFWPDEIYAQWRDINGR